MNNKKPLVTFAIFSFNQEKYIHDAVQAAFNQSYSPLHIILSDDNSSDKTFSIIENLKNKYSGIHKITLNKNNKNLGISGHINKVMDIAEGELIVVGAGDDISLPNRVAVLVDAWIKKNMTPDLLSSSYYVFNNIDNKKQIKKSCNKMDFSPEFFSKNTNGLHGATAAWTKRLWNSFPPLPLNVVNEDLILPFRASLLGGICNIDLPLVCWREGVSTWINPISSNVAIMQSRELLLYKRSLEVSCIHLNDALYKNRYDLISGIINQIIKYNLICKIYSNSKKINYIEIIYYLIKYKIGPMIVFKSIIKSKFSNVYNIYLKYK